MNKKIILGLTTAALLTTSVLAFNTQGQMRQSDNHGFKQGKMLKGQKHRGSFSFMKMVMKLDLSDKQRAEVKSIIKKSMQNLPNPNKAFTESSFNKKEFIKLANERRDAKIERKADMIGKVYAVLDSSQKKDLKTMLDMKEIMKKKMMQRGDCGAKNCNGRR